MDKIQEWITSHGDTFEEDMFNAHLMETVNRVRLKYDKYKVDEISQEVVHTVLRLPPYHCELNPIELVWAQIKHHIKMNNTSFKIKGMEQLIQQGFDNVTALRVVCGEPTKYRTTLNH
jgi:hypothetical protein